MPWYNTIQYVTHAVNVTLPASVTVVSANEVLRLAAVTLPVPLVTVDQLGDQELSVSTLTFRFPAGVPVFFNDSFSVLAATPLHTTFTATLVLALTSPMFCTHVACAKVTHLSRYIQSQALMDSQAINELSLPPATEST